MPTPFNPYDAETEEYFAQTAPDFERRNDILRAAAAQAQHQPDPLAGIPTEELEAAFRRAAMSDDEREDHVLTMDACENFIDSTPEYVVNPRNGSLMLRELERLGLDTNRVESFQQAYQSLRADGLVEVNAEAEQQLREEVRQERRKHRVGGLSSKRSAPIPDAPAQPDYSRMSLQQLEALALRAAMQGEF